MSDRAWNEIVVDGRGNIYVNGAGFDLMAGEQPAPGMIALVTPDGSATGSAWMPKAPSGTATCRTGAAFVSARVARLETIELDRGCFACMLGGSDGRTLFMMAAEWRGPANMFDGSRTGRVLSTPAPAPVVGRPYRDGPAAVRRRARMPARR